MIWKKKKKTAKVPSMQCSTASLIVMVGQLPSESSFSNHTMLRKHAHFRDVSLFCFNSGPKNSKEKKLLDTLRSVYMLWMRKHYGNGDQWIDHAPLAAAVILAYQSPEVGMWEQQAGMLTSQPYGSGIGCEWANDGSCHRHWPIPLTGRVTSVRLFETLCPQARNLYYGSLMEPAWQKCKVAAKYCQGSNKDFTFKAGKQTSVYLESRVPCGIGVE